MFIVYGSLVLYSVGPGWAQGGQQRHWEGQVGGGTMANSGVVAAPPVAPSQHRRHSPRAQPSPSWEELGIAPVPARSGSSLRPMHRSRATHPLPPMPPGVHAVARSAPHSPCPLDELLTALSCTLTQLCSAYLSPTPALTAGASNLPP